MGKDGLSADIRTQVMQHIWEKQNMQLLTKALRSAFRVEIQLLDDMFEYNLKTVLMTCGGQIISKTSISNVVFYEAEQPEDVMDVIMKNLHKAAELYRNYRGRTTNWSHYFLVEE